MLRLFVFHLNHPGDLYSPVTGHVDMAVIRALLGEFVMPVVAMDNTVAVLSRRDAALVDDLHRWLANHPQDRKFLSCSSHRGRSTTFST